jgi:SAM-dependent methyltransferase
MESFENFLYSHPDLYDAVFPDRVSSTFWRGAIERHAPAPVQSLLDIGCGTGSTLEVMARGIPKCVGVDLLPEMIAYGKTIRPNLDLSVGDMRTVRLERSFDALGCFGWAFSYALTDEDVSSVLGTFAAHSHAGTLLAIDCGHAEFYLGRGSSLPPVAMDVDVPGLQATTSADLEVDDKRSILVRRRKWDIAGVGLKEDYCEYRLHDPNQLRYLLAERGFKVCEMAGDPTGRQLAPGERTLFVVAVRE